MGEETTTQIPSSTTETNQLYIPSSMEKKRAILMYLLLWIVGALWANATRSEYERFHLSQSIGRWIIFVLLLIVSLIFLFVPLIKYIPLIVILIMIVILGICMKQASDGKYGRKVKNSLSLFAGIGEWMLGLFEVKEEKAG